MTVTIRRAEIQAIAERHGVSMNGLPDGLTVDAARELVRLVRQEAGRISMAKFEDAARRHLLNDATAELDALVDRIEREAPV